MMKWYNAALQMRCMSYRYNAEILWYNIHMIRQKIVTVGGIELTLVFKRVKHLRITVKAGSAIVSIPQFMPQQQAQAFILQKLDWIKKHLERSAPPQEEKLADGDIVPLWGREYVLRTSIGGNKCSFDENYIYLQTQDGSLETRRKLLNALYRKELLCKGKEFLQHWQSVTGLKSNELRVRDMRTRWGSCNIKAKRLWLSLRLARFEERCASYVILHELLHLAEKGHNKRFYQLLSQYLCDWKTAKKLLNGKAVEIS